MLLLPESPSSHRLGCLDERCDCSVHSGLLPEPESHHFSPSPPPRQLKLTDVIDNTWTLATERADAAGIELAHVCDSTTPLILHS
jgi:hypothetical protein